MICEKCGIEYEEDSCPACAAVNAAAVAEEANELPPCAEKGADITAMEQSETITECAEAEEQTEAITECAEAEEQSETISECTEAEEQTEAITERAEAEEQTEAITDCAEAEEQTEAITECAEADEQSEAIIECAEVDEQTEESCPEEESEPTPKRTLCNKCGTVYEGLNCPSCVAKAKIEMEKKRATEKKGKKLGLSGMIISLASLWVSVMYYPGLHMIPVGIVSLVLSIIGKCKYRRSKTATVGIIVSILQMVFNVVMTILTVVGLTISFFLALLTASAGGLTISDIDSVF